MTTKPSEQRQRSLQQAASVIFALVAVVPLLIFAYTVHALDGLRRSEVQIALALALGIALLGFWQFRLLLARMSEVVQALAKALEQASRSRLAGTTAPASPPAPVGASMVPGAGTAPSPFTVEKSTQVAGIGPIRELGEIERTMEQLWRDEARVHHGRRVQVTVANAAEPLIGVIIDVTEDGFFLQQQAGTVPISYRRVHSIQAVGVVTT